MKLLSWNLNGRRAAPDQVAAVARRSPDVVAFQEVTEGTIGILRRTLIEHGLPFQTLPNLTTDPGAAVVGSALTAGDPASHAVRVRAGLREGLQLEVFRGLPALNPPERPAGPACDPRARQGSRRRWQPRHRLLQGP